MEELEREGWNVHGKIHVITIGVRATVPTRNDEVLKEMGVSEKRDRKSLQQDLVWTSAKHAAAEGGLADNTHLTAAVGNEGSGRGYQQQAAMRYTRCAPMTK